jgi:dTDP-4-dehydrorhamnose 3,5-epimerase-like enzyme
MRVPASFFHVYCALEPNAEVIYKITDYAAHRISTRGFNETTPTPGMNWPVDP